MPKLPFEFISLQHLRFVLLTLAVLVVHACGFHLRGSIDVSDEIAPVYLQQNSVFELAREIKSLLISNNIETVDDVGLAKTQLTLLNESKNTRVLSVDGSGQAREYQLTYTANFSIKVKGAKEATESVKMRRDIIFDSTAVLGFANESEILYKDMRKQAARLILLKLQAASRNAGVQQETGQDMADQDASLTAPAVSGDAGQPAADSASDSNSSGSSEAR